jgi:hypothetical protein
LEEEVLYDTYWKRLADTLKSAKRIYFSPDGIYHKVNVNTLRNPITGKYVLEEKEIRFISQSRDFITRKEAANKLPDKMMLFGSPNYNKQRLKHERPEFATKGYGRRLHPAVL